ncbi:MAG: SHOCT domain-containing protein [Solirubrobacteraceae bacterium]
MAGKHRARAQAEDEQDAYNAGQQSATASAPPPPAPPAPAGPGTDDISRLKQLGELHAQGVLTDDEFATEKARILGAT